MVECYYLCRCGVCNGVMTMICSGVMRMHEVCVRPACQLKIFPFILCGCGMYNGVIPMVCSGVMRMNAGCVRPACKLQFFFSSNNLYAKFSNGQGVNTFSIPRKIQEKVVQENLPQDPLIRRHIQYFTTN